MMQNTPEMLLPLPGSHLLRTAVTCFGTTTALTLCNIRRSVNLYHLCERNNVLQTKIWSKS